jgi:hypothetical protein
MPWDSTERRSVKPQASDPTAEQAALDKFRTEERSSRDVSAGPRQARYQSILHGIAHGADDDRNGRGSALRGTRGRRGDSDNDIDLQVDEFGGERGKPFASPVPAALLNDVVPALDIAEIGQSLTNPAENFDRCLRVERSGY